MKLYRLLACVLLLAAMSSYQASASRTNHNNRTDSNSSLSYQEKLLIEQAEISKRIHNLNHTVIPTYERKIKHLCQMPKFADKCKNLEERLQNAYHMKHVYTANMDKLLIELDLEEGEPEELAISEKNNYLEDHIEVQDLNILDTESGFET
jgi:hypothetical protein